MLHRNAVAFSSVATTFNQFSTATALDGIDGSRLLYRSLVALSAAEAPAAFDSLSGEIHASARSILIDDSSHVRDAATGRLRAAASDRPVTRFMSYNAAGSPAATSDRFALWGDGYGPWGHPHGDGNAARAERHSAASDRRGHDDRPHLAFRRTRGLQPATFNVDARRSFGTSDNYHIGLYGGGEVGPVVLKAGAFYASHDVSTKRAIPFFREPRIPRRAPTIVRTRIRRSVRSGTGSGETRRRVEPSLNLAHVRLTNDAFAETATAAPVFAAAKPTPVTFTTLGMRATMDFDVGSGLNSDRRGRLAACFRHRSRDFEAGLRSDAFRRGWCANCRECRRYRC